MTDRYVVEDYEVFPDDAESEYWNDEYAPPYYEELDFNKDPETEYLPEEDLTDDENLETA